MLLTIPFAFSRPANTTAYTAGDVVGAADLTTPANAGSAVLIFKCQTQERRSGVILSASLDIDAAAIPGGMTSFTLHLYKGEPDARLDNAAWAKSSANDKAAYIGFLSLGSPAVNGSTLWVEADGINRPIQAAALYGNSVFWGELVTVGGYTPASGTAFTVTLLVATLDD